MAEKQEGKNKKQRRIYSTQSINQLIADRNQGYDIDFEPFFMRDLDLRNANIPFKMTEEELEEYQKCYDDPVYYAENYAKFMTDHGLSTVNLRDYQKNVISTVTAEDYDPEDDLILPVNRNIVWMSARQSGKCVSPCVSINYKDVLNNKHNKNIYDLYYDSIPEYELTFLKKAKRFLHKLYKFCFDRSLRISTDIVGKIIELVELYEYKDMYLDENDISKKIIDTRKLSCCDVLSDDGYVSASEVHLTQPYRVYEIILEDGNKIECADEHILYTSFGEEIFVSDLRIGYFVKTECGSSKVKSIRKCPYKMSMFDLTINHPNHRYYTNGILSHNTTTIAVFLSWMLIFHIDRNILIVANKEKTAIESVDKIINIFKGLPFWLKPGTEQWGKTALKLDNGSKILSSATTNTASIGFTIHCVLLDEFAHIPDNIVNNFWRSVYPTLSSSRVSQCIITSTPNGTTNKFYEIVSGAIEKKNSFRYIRTDYWEVPGHDDAWAAQMKADFGEEEFAQEFELQFNKNSKMLMKSEDMNFIDRLVKQYVHKTIYVNNQYVNDEHITWHPDFDPNDINENDIFVFLVDIAEGNGDPDERFQTKEKTPDANTINIFKVVLNSPANIKKYSHFSCRTQDCIRFVQIGKYKNSSEDEIQAARVCSALSYNVFKDHERNSVRVMVEMNFNGKSFFEEFKRHPLYTGSTVIKTYHKKPIPGEKQKRKYGFKTTANKEHYCIKGNKLISMHRTIVTCVDTFEQMKSFGYVRGKIKGIACHDDLSMPVFNHIPRMLEEKTFISWIDEYIQFKAERLKVYTINEIIQKWAMDNPEMSDDDFAGLYNLDENDSHVQQENNYIDFSHVTYGQTICGGFNYGGELTYSQIAKY